MDSYDIACPQIKKYERDIISRNLCWIFAKTNFIEETGQLKMLIKNEGERLSETEDISISDFMEIAIELIEGILATESRYLLLGTYGIRPELILINKGKSRFGKVKLIWYSNHVNAKTEIIGVLSFMSNRCKESQPPVKLVVCASPRRASF